ncbi:MAG: hypothetical protein R2877_01015 [Bdellovibrionota bacterium]
MSKLSQFNIGAQGSSASSSRHVQANGWMLHGRSTSGGGEDFDFQSEQPGIYAELLELIQVMMVIIAFSIIPIVYMKIKRGPTKIVDAH